MSTPGRRATAEGLARTLAPMRLSQESLEEDAQLRTIDFMSLLQIEDPGAAARLVERATR